MQNVCAKDFASLTDNQLVLQAKGGNRDCLTALVLKYLPFIEHRAKHYNLPGMEQDDIIQEGLIGLLLAVRSFDLEREIPFHRYFWICVSAKINSAVKKACKKSNMLLHNSLPLEEAETNCLVQSQKNDWSVDPSLLVIWQEERKAIQHQINVLLSSFEQDAFKLYLSGHSYCEMARSLHSTSKAVDNALQRVRRKLKTVRGTVGYPSL